MIGFGVSVAGCEKQDDFTDGGKRIKTGCPREKVMILLVNERGES